VRQRLTRGTAIFVVASAVSVALPLSISAHVAATGTGTGGAIHVAPAVAAAPNSSGAYEVGHAAQVLAFDRELNFDRDRLNVNGGAIAIGHPIGCTGTRITVTLLHEMLKRNTRRGVATLCVSGGLGMALGLENVV